MTLMIVLTPEMENRLEEEAAKRGLAVPECALRCCISAQSIPPLWPVEKNCRIYIPRCGTRSLNPLSDPWWRLRWSC